MTEIELIFIIIICFIFYLIKNPNKYNKMMDNIDTFMNKVSNINNFNPPQKTKRSVESPNPTGEHIESKVSSANVEPWRDMAFIGNKNPANYHKPSNIYSRKSLPVYYPISTPLEDNYNNYLNSISSPKLSMLRSVMHKVELYSNQGIKPIIFNYAERPFQTKKADPQRIKVLADTIIKLINNFSDSYFKVEYLSTQNAIHEETDEESRIAFDLKIKLFYVDYEKLGKKNQSQYDIIYIQPEFIFQKIYNDKLPEDQFFDQKIKADFRAYLSKLIIIGSENMGFLAGPEPKRGSRNRRQKTYAERKHMI